MLLKNHWSYNLFSWCYWVFLFFRVWFVGAVKNALHIIYLFLYMIYWSLERINVFFWWSDPGMHVDKLKGWNHVYWQPWTTSRAINPFKGEFHLAFSLRGSYWKMMVERRDNIGNLSWWSLYQVRTSSFLTATCEATVLQKTFNYESTLYLRIFPPL